jgi:hypothetical protein
VVFQSPAGHAAWNCELQKFPNRLIGMRVRLRRRCRDHLPVTRTVRSRSRALSDTAFDAGTTAALDRRLELNRRPVAGPDHGLRFAQ